MDKKRLFDGSTAKALGCATSLLALTVGLPSVAQAQDGSSDAEENRTLEEIVVTARSRAENLQSVPLSITAFSKEGIERRSIEGLEDVARFTSGFSFEDFSGGFATPVIRGQATTRVTALEGNVATFFDGIYIPRSWAIDVSTSNLARVEVVKGPQSARYGRNAFAGAVNFIPEKASFDGLRLEAVGTIGSDERYDAGGLFNYSFEDKFAIFGSVNYSTFDGTWRNDHPFSNLGENPGTNGNAGGYDRLVYSASVLFKPVESLRIELGYFGSDREDEYRPSVYFAERLGDLNGGPDRFGTGGGTLFVGTLPEPGKSVVVDPRAFGVDSKTDTFRASVDYDISENVTASYLFGLIDGSVLTGTSGEPDPINCGTVLPIYCNFQVAPIGGIDYTSHEGRLSYDDGSIRVSGGVFVQDGRDDFQFVSANLLPVTSATDFVPFSAEPGGGFGQDFFNIRLTDEITRTDVFSLFGEVGWTSEDGRLRASAEGRYSDTKIETEDLRRTLTLDETFKVFTPRATIEYDATEQSMLYATAARGAKAGGFNITAIAPENQTFDEETNWTYEIGAKNTLLDGRLTLNGAFFYTDWKNVQISSPDPDAANPNAVNITLNLGDASVWGFEFDAAYQATENLSFDATLSYSDAEYSGDTVDARLARNIGTGTICDDVICNSNGNIGGNTVERTPPTQFSLGSTWENRIEDWNANYFLRADVSWQSKFYATSANVGRIPSRTLVNARAGLNFEQFDVSIWATNLFDERYVTSAFAVLLPFGNTYGTFLGDRRAFGATVKFRY